MKITIERDPPAGKPRASLLERWAETCTSLLKIAAFAAAVLLAGGVVYALIADRKTVTVIAPFEISADVIAKGYSPALFQALFAGYLGDIDSSARSQILRIGPSPDRGLELEVAGTHVSYGALRQIVRRFSKSEDTVLSGTVTGGAQLSLRILISRPEGTVESVLVTGPAGSGSEIEDLAKRAAVQTVGRIAPSFASGYMVALESAACADKINCEFTESLLLLKSQLGARDDEQRYAANLHLAYILLTHSKHVPSLAATPPAELRRRAAVIAESAVRIFPNRPYAYDSLGQIAIEEGTAASRASALAYLRTAAEKGGDIAFIHADLAKALVYSGQEQAALEEFARAEKLNPNDANNDLEWGKALAILGQHEKAVEKFNAAAELNWSLYDARRNAAASLLVLGRKQAALDQLDWIIEIARLEQPTNELPDVYKDRGNILYSLGRKADAERDFDRVTQLKGNALWQTNLVSGAYVDWGKIRFDEQNWDEAEAKFNALAIMGMHTGRWEGCCRSGISLTLRRQRFGRPPLASKATRASARSCRQCTWILRSCLSFEVTATRWRLENCSRLQSKRQVDFRVRRRWLSTNTVNGWQIAAGSRKRWTSSNKRTFRSMRSKSRRK